MPEKKQRIIEPHYSWNSSIWTRAVVDPIKRRLGWVDANQRPVSLKESATGQELDRMKETAKDTGKIALMGLALTNPLTAKSTLGAVAAAGAQSYFVAEGLNDGAQTIGDMAANKSARNLNNAGRLLLDMAMTVPGWKPLWYSSEQLAKYGYNIARIANPKYRAMHAYNAIEPYGYTKYTERLKDWFKDMLHDRPVDLAHPRWENKVPVYNDSWESSFLGQNRKARMAAWRKYLQLPDIDSYYIPNGDGTFSYNLAKVKYPLKDVDPWTQIDWLTGNGGNLWRTSKLNPDWKTFHMEDMWDLHPFSRGTSEVKDELHKVIGSDRLYQGAQQIRRYMYDKGHWTLFSSSPTLIGRITKPFDRLLNQYRMGKYSPTLNNAVDKVVDGIYPYLKKFEIGPLVGGKPFMLKTDVPVKVQDGLMNLNTDVITNLPHSMKNGGSLKRIY